tara:strand:+ start:93 stop:833 length:741 start_codon:yes stop_codon:yes gene_type:complete
MLNNKKYDAHIRIKFSLFNDPSFRSISEKHRPYAYLVFICLLKFANSKTLTCYPRKATICDMSGLSRTTVYRATLCLIEARIIKKKRLKSTLLYMINPKYIVGYREDVSTGNTHVSTGNTDVSARPLLEELTYKTNIDTNKKYFSNKSSEVVAIIRDNIGNKELMINRLSELPLNLLKSDINNKYYCKLAIQRKDELAREKNATYVDPQKIISALNNIKKQSNVRYRQKVEYNKRNNLDYKGRPKK